MSQCVFGKKWKEDERSSLVSKVGGDVLKQIDEVGQLPATKLLMRYGMQLMSSDLSQDAAFMLKKVSCPLPLGGEDRVCAKRTCSREAAICSSTLLSNA